LQNFAKEHRSLNFMQAHTKPYIKGHGSFNNMQGLTEDDGSWTTRITRTRAKRNKNSS
jgi:hypothetical protein